MLWDLLLYVPTVVFLVVIGLMLWFSGMYHDWAYPLIFMATFFSLVGGNRILRTRLMLLPSAAIGFAVDKHRVCVELRNGQRLELVKNVKFYADFVGKSFAVTGMDLAGKVQKFIFHKGQFASEPEFNDAKSLLRVYG